VFRRQTAEDGRQDTALSEVVDIDRTVQPSHDLELAFVPVHAAGDDREAAPGRETRSDAFDRVRLEPGEANRRGRLAGQEFERQDTHPDQVRAMDPLIALGDDRADAQQGGPFRRPISRGPRAVLPTSQNDEWDALVPIPHRSVVDELLLAIREVNRVRPSLPSMSRFLSRTLPKVPRIITSWCPRQAPYE
jgi:hypothetical protein